ncbi:TPA: hypothetical protein DDW35_03620 [Candidatus Sumerlaeota bacterium]|nr:hypothetical protein [Candidatus Sumerlaeota bacterium]
MLAVVGKRCIKHLCACGWFYGNAKRKQRGDFFSEENLVELRIGHLPERFAEVGRRLTDERNSMAQQTQMKCCG